MREATRLGIARNAAKRDARALANPIGQRTLIPRLRHDTADCALMVLSDSVGAEDPTIPDPHEWVYMLGAGPTNPTTTPYPFEGLADRYPWMSIDFTPWDQTNQIWRSAVNLHVADAHASASATTTNLSKVVTCAAATQSWVNRRVTGTGIPAGNTITGVVEGVSFDLLVAAEASATVTVTVQPYKLTIWGAGNPGRWTIHSQAPYFESQIAGIQPDLFLVSHGHNRNTSDGEVLRREMTQFLETVSLACPSSEIAIIIQNVKLVAVGGEPISAGMRQRRAYREVAAAGGHGLIDVRQAFEAAAAEPGAAYDDLLEDQAHPNPTGYELYASTVLAAMPDDDYGIPREQRQSSLLAPVPGAPENCDFHAWADPAAAPDGLTANNVTFAKDFTNFEDPCGYSVRCTCTTAAAGYFDQTISGNGLLPYLGQWVTLAARIRVNNTDTQAGLPQIFVTNAAGTTNVAASAANTGEGMGGWRLTMVTMRVPTDCTLLRLRFNVDTGADGGADVSVQWWNLALGKLPRRPLATAIDPLGALEAWYKADELTGSDTDPVGTLPDASGRGRDLVQATAGSKPILKLATQNSLNVLRFDGSNDFMKVAGFTIDRPYTLFIVCKFLAAYGSTAVVVTDTSLGAGKLRRASSTTMETVSTSQGPILTTTPEAWHLYEAFFDTTGGTLLADAGAAATDANQGAGEPVGITIGANEVGSGGQPANIDLAEALWFPGSPTAAGLAYVRAYLKEKWATP